MDVIASDRTGFAKSDPHVGDRHDLDVVAPRDVGIDAVHVDRSDRGPLTEPARITRLDELPRWL